MKGLISINLKGKWATRDIWLNGKKLSPAKSLARRNHSPDGFNWGYAGSGPAQLALAICIELDLDKYQNFKFDHIATLPQSDFEKEIKFNRRKYIDYERRNTSIRR